jgi:proteasome lid subunit RPN8/RPN11
VKPFALSSALLTQIYRHCIAGYPDEACGILMGPLDGAATQVAPCTNIQNDLHKSDPAAYPRDARTAYLIDPKDLFRLTREARDQGGEFKAIFHSHADVGAYFSDEDQRQAAPFMTLSASAFAKSEGLTDDQLQDCIQNGTARAQGDQITARMPTYPELVYLVVDVTAGKAKGIRGFFWNDRQRTYLEIPVDTGVDGAVNQ